MRVSVLANEHLTRGAGLGRYGWGLRFVFTLTVPNGAAGVVGFPGGATDTLLGLNIDIDFVVSTDTPANDGFLGACVGCVINFETGPIIGSASSA